MSTETILSLLNDINTKVDTIGNRLDVINTQLTGTSGASAPVVDLSGLATKEDLNGLATQASLDAVKVDVETIIADIGTVGEAVAAVNTPSPVVDSAAADKAA